MMMMMMIISIISIHNSAHPRIDADFLGAMGANAPRENSSVGASLPKEFGPKNYNFNLDLSSKLTTELEKYNYNTIFLKIVLQYQIR